MRLILLPLSLLLLLSLRVYAQSDAIRLRLNTDISDYSWRFQAGDDPAWASPAYIDTAWAAVDADESIRRNGALWKAGRGWFRLVVKPTQALLGKDTYIAVRQFGESEIFVDGRRIATLKPARIDSGGSQRLMMLVPLRFADTNRHVLAIRYAFRKSPIVFAATGRTPLNLRFGRSDEVLVDITNRDRLITGVEVFSAGVYAILSLLLFLFYRANRTRKIHRVLAFSMLTSAGASFIDGLSSNVSWLTLLSLLEWLSNALSTMASSLLLAAAYLFTNQPRGWGFRIAIGSQLLYFAYQWFIGPMPEYAGIVPFLFLFVDFVRISRRSRRSESNEARLPWNSLKVALYTLLSIIPIILIATIGIVLAQKMGYQTSSVSSILESAVTLIMLVAILSVPVGLSLSSVYDYARTHQSLGEKLREVEALSARTLAQEQEKQALLAQQNERLEQQVRDRTAALNQSLTDLRATQDQLVQREKLASLGELTAGIAHEIQNPLNFVNNFSEVSAELIAEVAAERAKTSADRDDALTDELLGDLTGNIGKIHHHGQRAASIVRGMLQHSRSHTGEREPTDLNALVDEYLRLSYHGLRRSGQAAKDKPSPVGQLNATLATDLAPDLPLVSMATQDVGRVLLNLFNNAFYAVQQRAATAGPTYQPTVTARTRLLGRCVEIVVEDNGTGIPEAARSKIFQPFFTTKPTGQGTGLGLSLSYDIITKGHGGTLTVESEAGQGTRFTIQLPIN